MLTWLILKETLCFTGHQIANLTPFFEHLVTSLLNNPLLTKQWIALWSWICSQSFFHCNLIMFGLSLLQGRPCSALLERPSNYSANRVYYWSCASVSEHLTSSTMFKTLLPRLLNQAVVPVKCVMIIVPMIDCPITNSSSHVVLWNTMCREVKSFCGQYTLWHVVLCFPRRENPHDAVVLHPKNAGLTLDALPSER